MTQNMKSRAAGVTSEGTFTPDELVVCLEHGGKRTFVSGAGVMARGTVIGKITTGAASSAAKSGGNTGNGTFVLDGTTPILANDVQGVYTLRCVAAVANGGTFELKRPDGFSLGRYDITGGAGGTVTIADQIKGVLTDGATDFVVGDGFDITIAAGSAKYKTSIAAAVDGSQVPYGVLLEDIDATSADADGMVLIVGEVNSNKLTFGAGHSLATVYDAFRGSGIVVSTAIPW